VILGRIERYLLRETGVAWLGVTVVLVVVLLTNRLIRFMAEAASGGIPADAIFTLLGLKAVAHLSTVLPASLFLGVMLALGRLQDDSEMTAMAACGVGPGRLYRAIFAVAVPVALLVAACSLILAPLAERTGEIYLAKAQQDLEFQGVRAGRFMTLADGELVIYAESVAEDGTLRDVFAVGRDGAVERVVVAASAERSGTPEGGQYLLLENGERLDILPPGEGWQRIGFDTHGVRLEGAQEVAVRFKRDTIATAALLASAGAEDLAELHWRAAMPITTLVLALIAVPLARSAPRQGRYGKLVLAVLLFITYFNLLKAGQDWIGAGHVPAWLGLWWVHGLFAGLGAWALAVRYRVFARVGGGRHGPA
jgi:lipopolysaccharide export system permease protein